MRLIVKQVIGEMETSKCLANDCMKYVHVFEGGGGVVYVDLVNKRKSVSWKHSLSDLHTFGMKFVYKTFKVVSRRGVLFAYVHLPNACFYN